MAVDPGAHRLHHQPPSAPGDVEEALGAQEAVRRRDIAQAGGEGVRVVDGVRRHREAFEFVVVVFPALPVVVRAAVVQVGLGGRFQAEQDAGGDAPVRRLDDARAAPQMRAQAGFARSDAGFGEQVGLVEDHQVGAGDLVFEDLGERRLVIEGVVGRALRLERGFVVGETAFRERRAVDHRDHAVHREPGANLGPVEGRDQRLGEREAGGLDEDVLGRRVAGQQRFDRRHEVVGDGATEAAVGELDHIGRVAGLIAAAAQHRLVDPEIAELVDDHGDAPSVRGAQRMADEAGFAGPEKAGDDGGGDFPILHHASRRDDLR